VAARVPFWFGVFGGALAWALQLFGGYAVVGLACTAGSVLAERLSPAGLDVALLLLTALAAAVTVSAGVVAYGAWRQAGTTEVPGEEAPARAVQGLLALAGVLLSALFLLAILLQGVSPYFVRAC
jgi:TRAP-type C4-dicarboxylate transport system permease small subunit